MSDKQADSQTSEELHKLLDKYARNLSVLGLRNHGYSTDAQEKVKELEQAIARLRLQDRILELEKVDPIASHRLAATVSDRISALRQQLTELEGEKK